MTIELEIAWRLININRNQIVWQETIMTSSIGGPGVAWNFFVRIKLLSEKAAKENVRTAMNKISKLNL